MTDLIPYPWLRFWQEVYLAAIRAGLPYPERTADEAVKSYQRRPPNDS